MSDIIAEGREAWARIKNRDKATFDDWVLIGRCLIEARRQCMARAGANSPFGPKYQAEMRKFLDAAGMADLDDQHLGEIEAYRATLTDAERSRCNHVNTILKYWRDGGPPQKQGPKPRELLAPFDTGKGGFSWPDDARRRVVLALRNTQGQPLPVQADAALKAAIRSLADYEALKPQLNMARKKRAPAQSLEPSHGLNVHA